MLPDDGVHDEAVAADHRVGEDDGLADPRPCQTQRYGSYNNQDRVTRVTELLEERSWKPLHRLIKTIKQIDQPVKRLCDRFPF